MAALGCRIDLVVPAIFGGWGATNRMDWRLAQPFATAAFRHNLSLQRGADEHGGDAMHIFDYAAIGFLIACMIWAGAMALHKAP